MSYIPLGECKQGWTYEIHSRNLAVGVFNAEKKGFVGIREKFGNRYLFTEFHYDTGAPHGTVRPKTEIEECPIKDIRETLGTVCYACMKAIEYKPDPTAAPYPGRWTHLESGDCKNERSAGGVSNKPLFEYLEEIEKRIPKDQT